MTQLELIDLLEIPEDIKLELTKYGQTRTSKIPVSIQNKILKREEWEEGIKELQELCIDDSYGIKILWELLHIIASFSYEEYKKRQINESVFVATMKFCTRFFNDSYKNFHVYKFMYAWWFPRQISLQEFRIGALEYEFIENEKREIAVHIPSDANMNKESISQSLDDFNQFRNTYFPEWETVTLTCETWMLMPELKTLLGEKSNVVAFQNLFEMDSLSYEETWYMEWIFPGYEHIDETLPERTSLQRKLKAYLLEGNKFGIAKGHLKNF